jgi:hypothetical protein
MLKAPRAIYHFDGLSLVQENKKSGLDPCPINRSSGCLTPWVNIEEHRWAVGSSTGTKVLMKKENGPQ